MQRFIFPKPVEARYVELFAVDNFGIYFDGTTTWLTEDFVN
jgi:hypothetical protein